MQAIHERQLLDAARQGNSESFDQLIRIHHNRLLGSVESVVGCRADAEDVVQDTWIIVWTNLHSFRGASSFYTWLHRIAINGACRRRGRARFSRIGGANHGSDDDEPEDPSAGPLERLVGKELLDEIQSALQSLADPHRVILELVALERLDYARLAQRLDTRPGTVRSRLHRARQHLRTRLQARGFLKA